MRSCVLVVSSVASCPVAPVSTFSTTGNRETICSSWDSLGSETTTIVVPMSIPKYFFFDVTITTVSRQVIHVLYSLFDVICVVVCYLYIHYTTDNGFMTDL